jgi:rod shape-determining protein MreC
MKNQRNILIWVVLSVMLLFFDKLGVLNFAKIPLETYAFSFKKPVYFLTVSAGNWAKLLLKFPDMKKVKDDNERLKRENDDLIYKNKLIISENEIYRKQLGAVFVSSYKNIPAHILGISRFMDISIGERDGVKKGMPIVNGSVFVGIIQNTTYNRSQAILPTDTEIRITGKTIRGTHGVISGQSGDTIIFSEVLQKDPLFLGDEILTDGVDGLPPNLLIGKVIYIKSDDVSVYKQAKIDKAIDIRKIDMVFAVSELK